MILPPFRYLRPDSASAAVDLLDTVEGAMILAGGQTLINALKLDLVGPDALVDIHRLEELRGVRRVEGGTWIGAATTYNEVAASAEVRSHAPAVATMASGLVDRQVRNRGTLGGNCCLNDPTNNMPPLLSALEATFDVLTIDGSRSLAADEFFIGTLLTAATGGGLLTGIIVPDLPSGAVVIHRHQQLAKDSWALARVVVRLDPVSADGSRPARVFVGAVPGSPVRLRGVEAALCQDPLGSDWVERALAAFDTEDFDVIGDVHGSAGYRRRMARVQLKRALTDISLGRVA